MIAAFAYSTPMITSVMPDKWRRRLSKGAGRRSVGLAGAGLGGRLAAYRRNTAMSRPS